MEQLKQLANTQTEQQFLSYIYTKPPSVSI